MANTLYFFVGYVSVMLTLHATGRTEAFKEWVHTRSGWFLGILMGLGIVFTVLANDSLWAAMPAGAVVWFVFRLGQYGTRRQTNFPKLDLQLMPSLVPAVGPAFESAQRKKTKTEKWIKRHIETIIISAVSITCSEVALLMFHNGDIISPLILTFFSVVKPVGRRMKDKK